MTKASAAKQEREWQAEDDHRTLTRAQEIQADGKRMAGVRRHHRKAMRALTSAGRMMKGGR